MQIVDFTPISGLLGGVIMGTATCLFMYLNGKILGISGMLRGLSIPIAKALKGKKVKITHNFLWRVAFITGLFLGALIIGYYMPEKTVLGRKAPPYLFLVLAGFLVGYGSSLGHGGTSGHGICGLARRSKRSILAASLFVISGFVSTYILRYVLRLWSWQ